MSRESLTIRSGSRVRGLPSFWVPRGRGPATEPPGEPPQSSLNSGPPTRPAAIFAVAVAGIGFLICIILEVRAGQADPIAIKAELRAKLEEIDKTITNEQVIRKDEAIHRILEAKLYQQYGGDVYANLKKTHRILHPSAELQAAADAEIPPYLEEVAALLANPVTMTDARLDDELDKGKSLWNKYGSTSRGPKIKESLEYLLNACTDRCGTHCGGVPNGPWSELGNCLMQFEFVKARKLIDDYEFEHCTSMDDPLSTRLKTLRQQLAHATVTFAQDILAQADRLSQNDQEDEARRIVAQALPRLEGFFAQNRLRAFLRSRTIPSH